MTWEEVLEANISDGAVRLWEASKGWRIFYRIRTNRWEGRSSVRDSAGQWRLVTKPVGGREEGGWAPVRRIHHHAMPIKSKRAEGNPGYFAGLTQRCETCKVERPLGEFSHQNQSGQSFRTWECDECAKIRLKETKLQSGATRVGDYLRRNTHASKPPVESEI